MLVVVLLVIVLAIVAVAGLVTWSRRARSAARIIGAPAGGEYDRLFPGDVLSRHIMMSGSLARLEFFDWGVRLHGLAISRWVVPTWEARYEELAIVDLVTLRFSRFAVWLRLRGSSDGIGFLTHWSRDILREFEKHDVPVNRSVIKVTRAEELYRSPS
ncbi:MAG TPA: hypothetical protein VME44_05190 [Streptosporangiaceae bacterium]|nr:hypothetical protein [Streptosporangiaceae bacterium]